MLNTPENHRTRQQNPKPGAEVEPTVIISQAGFTLPDVAIATAIFSMILVICLGAFISMGRIYFKSSTEIRTQEVVRSVMDEISRKIATTAADVYVLPPNPPSPWSAYCIAGIKYSYRKGYQLDRDPPTGSNKKVRQVFVKSIVTDTSGNPTGNCNSVIGISNNPAPPSGGATKKIELIDHNMRLENFEIVDLYAPLYIIKLDIVYGGDPDYDDLEKEVFEFHDETVTPLEFKLDDPDPAKRARCTLGETFCYILRSRREVYQSIVD